MLKQLLYVYSLTLLLTTSLMGQSVVAQFNPSQIYPDQVSNYIIKVSGRQAPSNFEPPQVDGLQVIATNSSRNISFGTGKGTRMVSNFQYTIRAAKPGKYTIPTFTIDLDGNKTQVPSATLTVLPMSTSRQQMLDDQKREEKKRQDEMFALRLKLPEGKIYVGQAIPVDIMLYIRDDIRVYQNAPSPQKVGDAFSIKEFSDQGPEQTQMRANNGNVYQMITWKTVITPLKTGKQMLNFNFEAVISSPSKQRSHSRFFDSFFDEKQKVIAHTDDYEVDILPLPTADKPATFSGGIGSFSLKDPILSDKQVKAGEPVTLSIEVSGSGNFNRMNAPELQSVDGWQIYDPEEAFIPDDELGLKGTKRFDYTIIPNSKDVTTTPNMVFTYYNPQTGKYVSYKPESVAITVIPNKTNNQPIFIPQPRTQDGQQLPDEEKKEIVQMLPIRLTAGTWVNSLMPVLRSPVFLASQAIPLIALIGLIVFRRNQLKLLTDSAYARSIKSSKTTQEWLNKSKDAAGQNDATAFYNAAVRTIQECIGAFTKQEPESLTLAEIENHLIGVQASPETLVTLRDFFESADAMKFSGGNVPLSNPNEAFNQLQGLIEDLKKNA